MNRTLSKITLLLMWFVLGWMAFSSLVLEKSSQSPLNAFLSLAILHLAFLVAELEGQLKALRNG